ncbi:MAG: sugar ABC transporter ATP-binding protein [Pelotomaculum sp.]|nr:sugar ABC transporter ATP-binding protein [Pelotomaculum sp.]
MTSALRLHSISKIYPGTVALHRVNLDVKEGEVHGIIGKNGAGKSTLVGIIAGIIQPTEGEIFVGDKKFEALSRIIAKKEGISIVTQDPQVVLDFTVAENLFVADYICRGRLINWKELYARAQRLIGKAGLNINARAKAEDLSISERQLLLVLKACYVERARILILDEASASLSQEDEKVLYRIIEERKKEGNTVIFISHRADELLKVCDRITVIRDGRSVATKNCRDLNKEELSSLIVGHGPAFQPARKNTNDNAGAKSGETVLTVENLTRLGAYEDISFELKKGEILGLAGLRGSGRTELLKGIAGIEPPEKGWVKIGKAKRRFSNPSQALRSGVVYLPEDRESEGLINGLSVRENLVLNSLHKVCRGFLIRRKREREFVSDLIEMLNIKAASPEQEVGQLSGGNKQKVVVGRISANLPKVFLLDEPTKGIDISAKESILQIIKEKLSRSAGIIITSPGLDDLITTCDRIIILYKGRIAGQFLKGEFRESDLYLAVQGMKKAN